MSLVFLLSTEQGSCGSLKVLERPWIFFQIFKAWKVLENRYGPWKVLEFDFDKWARTLTGGPAGPLETTGRSLMFWGTPVEKHCFTYLLTYQWCSTRVRQCTRVRLEYLFWGLVDSNPPDSDLDSIPLDSDSNSNPRTRLDSRCSGIRLSTVWLGIN